MKPITASLPNFRTLVVMLMTGLILAFTSAEVRAATMVRMAEEQGVGRFYEDKVHHVDGEVRRLAQLQNRRQPVEQPLRLHPPLQPDACQLYDAPTRRAACPRAPPHLPRAPPRHA